MRRPAASAATSSSGTSATTDRCLAPRCQAPVGRASASRRSPCRPCGRRRPSGRACRPATESPLPRVRLLAAVLGRIRRVGDLRGALLRHALVLQRFVLLLVLDVRALARHVEPPRLGPEEFVAGIGAGKTRRCSLGFEHACGPDNDDDHALPRAGECRRPARGLLVGPGVILGRWVRGLRVRDRRLVESPRSCRLHGGDYSCLSSMHVVLPDNSELELPDGATGLDAARAIGPKLAEQAVLIRAERPVQDLRAPLTDGAADPDPDRRATRDDPDALYVLRHSAAHLLAEAVRRLYPGVKIAIGPPIENGFYYDFEFPEPITEADLAEDRGRGAARAEGRPHLGARGDLARRGAARASRPKASRTRSSSSTPPRATSRCTPRASFTDLCRGPHLQNSKPIKAFKLTGARRRLLARRREEHAADPHLRHRVLLAGRPRRVPRAARGGAQARPPPARRAARPLPPRGDLAGLAVLAPEGDGDLERARGRCAAARTRAAATSR